MGWPRPQGYNVSSLPGALHLLLNPLCRLPPPHHAIATLPDEVHTVNILVASHDRVLARALRLALTREGHRVSHTSDAATTIDHRSMREFEFFLIEALPNTN